MMVLEQHPAVKIVQIGGRLRGWKRRMGNRNQPFFDRLRLFDQGRGFIGLAGSKRRGGLPGKIGKPRRIARVPAFARGVRGFRRRRRPAGGEQEGKGNRESQTSGYSFIA